MDLTVTELVCNCYADRPLNAKHHYAVRRLSKKTKPAYIMALFLGAAANDLDEKVPGLSAVTKSFGTALDAVRKKDGGRVYTQCTDLGSSAARG